MVAMRRAQGDGRAPAGALKAFSRVDIALCYTDDRVLRGRGHRADVSSSDFSHDCTDHLIRQQASMQGDVDRDNLAWADLLCKLPGNRA